MPEIFNASLEPRLNAAVNFSESDNDSVYSPIDTKLLNKAAAPPPPTATTTSNSRSLVPVPAMSIEALSMVPSRKPRWSELTHRRIRRPFSVSEVEALVHQAVEKLGTGRSVDNSSSNLIFDESGLILVAFVLFQMARCQTSSF